MLSGKTQHRALTCYQNEGMKILNILFARVAIEPTTCGVAYGLYPCATDPKISIKYSITGYAERT